MDNNNITTTDDAKKYLKLILTEGNTIPVDKDVDTYELQLPSWYNENLFKRAQKFYFSNIWSMFLGKLIGLLSILAIPSILDILVTTKQSSTPKTAYRRYLATIFHTMNWYDEDLKPGTKSWKSLQAVRKRHVVMSKFSCNHQSGIISQKDMALTQFGFMGFILIKNKMLGIKLNDENCDAFVHFWRVIGYMIGIEDRFNICTDSFKTTKPRLEIILSDILRPCLENASSRFNDMCDALITGLWCFNPMLDTNSFIYFTKRLAGVKGYYYYESEIEKYGIEPILIENKNQETTNHYNLDFKIDADDDEKDNSSKYKNLIIPSLGIYSRCVLWLLIFVHEILMRFFLVRWYYNLQIMLSKIIISYFPFLAIIKFGMRDAYVRILKKE